MGPLTGLRVVEFAGIGPGPFCGTLLADMGADVVRIDRPTAMSTVGSRGRRSVVLDLKSPQDVETALCLMDRADAVYEGYRPGVAERLGVGPDVAMARNPRLVYGRMTGWGQTGPMAVRAGHDINYIGMAGALHGLGPADKPSPPLNLVGDYGGGALYLVVGLLAGIIEARSSGKGQVVDCAMVDGAASLMSIFYEMFGRGGWADRRAANSLDGSAANYDTYQCGDGKWVAVGAVETEFFEVLLGEMGLDPEAFGGIGPARASSALKAAMVETFKTRTRDEWCERFAKVDACAGPVLTLAEAPHHPANVERGVFVEVDGIFLPAPAPRFSRTPSAIHRGTPNTRANSADVLEEWATRP